MTMPLVAAHRGASRAERENTIKAFQAAGRLGAAMVELDVRRTADGDLVVHHDATIGAISIVAMHTDQLPTYVPLLSDALDACGAMEVNIEIKSDRREPDYDESHHVARHVVALLRVRGDGQRMLISSFDMDAIDQVHALDPTLRTGFLFTVPLPNIAALVDDVVARGHVALHPHRHAAVAELVDAAHHHGLVVNVWTVDVPDEMRRLAAIGVDVIITNVPDIAAATLSHES